MADIKDYQQLETSSPSETPPPDAGVAETRIQIQEKEDPEVLVEPEGADMVMVALAWFALILFFPLTIWNAFKVVNSYERAVIFRLGKLKSHDSKSGLVFKLPCTDDITVVDIRTRTVNIPPQEILTADSVTCQVDGVLFYDVVKPTYSVTKVEDAAQSVSLLASSALRGVLGHRTLGEILSAKETITRDILLMVDERAQTWGIKVQRVDLKDMKLAPQLQRALVAEAETARTARAKVIQADGEHKAAAMLKQASDILNQDKVSVQLRYLQTLTHVSGMNNKTIVFPLPPHLAERALSSLISSVSG